MKPTDDELDALLKRLHLANARRIWQQLVQRAEKEEWSYRDFLVLLVAEEIAQRQQTRLGRLSRRASFPFFKTIDDFNFTYQSTVRLSLLGSALSPDFITEGRCLILFGKPGRGKTHLAVALAYRTIQNGFDAFFTTAAELIDDLSAAFREGRLAEALTTYTHPALLVVDEVGYLTYGTDAANMLFHVVNDRHRRKRSMIFTTNKPIAAWGKVLHDEDLAQAIVDRVLERGRLLTLDGPSMRTKHLRLDEAISGESNQGDDNPARISGIPRPEFPEPPSSKQSKRSPSSFRLAGSTVAYADGQPNSPPRDARLAAMGSFDQLRRVRQPATCSCRSASHSLRKRRAAEGHHRVPSSRLSQSLHSRWGRDPTGADEMQVIIAGRDVAGTAPQEHHALRRAQAKGLPGALQARWTDPLEVVFRLGLRRA